MPRRRLMMQSKGGGGDVVAIKGNKNTYINLPFTAPYNIDLVEYMPIGSFRVDAPNLYSAVLDFPSSYECFVGCLFDKLDGKKYAGSAMRNTNYQGFEWTSGIVRLSIVLKNEKYFIFYHNLLDENLNIIDTNSKEVGRYISYPSSVKIGAVDCYIFRIKFCNYDLVAHVQNGIAGFLDMNTNIFHPSEGSEQFDAVIIT